MTPERVVPLILVLTEAEFEVLTEVGEDNQLTPEVVLKAMLEEYVDLRANYPFLFFQFAVFREWCLK
jgi:hypothetical protein